MDTFDNTPQNPQPEIFHNTPSQEQSAEANIPEQEDAQPSFVPSAEAEPAEAYTSPAPEPYRYVPQRSAGKESPFANSPYVRQIPQEEPAFRYQPQTQPEQKPRKKRSGFWRKAVAALLTVVLIAGGCLITGYSVNSRWEARTQQLTDQMNQQIQALQEQISQAGTPASGTVPSYAPVVSGDALSPSQIYAQNVDSVVAVSVVVEGISYGQIVEGTSSGSGFILTEDGYVVTNYHVVEGAVSVSVIMHDETELEAKVVGFDSANDVAVLKVEAQGLPAAALGSSSSLNVGDMVVAIGNPLGELNATQTVGYICGKDREVTTGGTIINMLQTDAAINPGNSGGPLFNMYGQVVGITTAKYSGTTSSGASIEGIGFAIPIDDVLGIISDLQSYGYVTGAYLGVTVQNIDASTSQLYGISGAYVLSVEPGYSADRAGIRAKDLIVGLDGQEIGSITDLTRGLRQYKSGDTVTITLIREGVRMDVDVTLDEKPQSLTTTVPEFDEDMPEGDFEEWYDYFRRHFGG